MTGALIGAAIDVHRELGPGLLEAIYEDCLAWELSRRSIPYERQKPVPVIYKGRALDATYRVDLLVDSSIVVELKAVDALLPVHLAQVLSYVTLTACPLGLLLNFNAPRLVDGLKRVVNRNVDLPEGRGV
jgi:GxxExxY protein